MTGCYTCGGGMGKHDPVAHDQVLEGERWGPSLFQAETCLEPGVWMIDGFTVRRLSSHRLWAIYGPCDEFGTAKTLADARHIIRNGEVPL